jgi:hypothetical protein
LGGPGAVTANARRVLVLRQAQDEGEFDRRSVEIFILSLSKEILILSLSKDEDFSNGR